MVEQKHKLELVVDGVPYLVNVTPFSFNEETRFNVSYNGSPEVIFLWDTQMKKFTAIGDDASSVPDSLESAIAEKLQAGKF